MKIQTGIDIIEIERIKKAMDRWGDNFLNHVLNQEEIDYIKQYKHPAQHVAARFAAKEAIYKAISTDQTLGWKDMTILNDANGCPYCKFKEGKGANNLTLSISHSKHYAVANAIITT